MGYGFSQQVSPVNTIMCITELRGWGKCSITYWRRHSIAAPQTQGSCMACLNQPFQSALATAANGEALPPSSKTITSISIIGTIITSHHLPINSISRRRRRRRVFPYPLLVHHVQRRWRQHHNDRYSSSIRWNHPPTTKTTSRWPINKTESGPVSTSAKWNIRMQHSQLYRQRQWRRWRLQKQYQQKKQKQLISPAQDDVCWLDNSKRH